MAEQIQKARMQQKRDITTNWQMAPNFVPKPGEIIVYGDKEKDKYLDPTTPSRIKVGDGITPVGELPGISGELYVQEQEPTNAGEGALWVSPDNTQINPGISAVSDWKAREGEVGYVQNKPIEIIQTYITLTNDEEIMASNSYLYASENFYHYKNMDNIELVLEGLEDYVFINQAFGSFLDLTLYLEEHAAEFQTENVIAMCSASFLGMSLTSLAVIHIVLAAEGESGTSTGESSSIEGLLGATNYSILMVSNDVETSLYDGELPLPVGTHFILDEIHDIYISSLKFNYNAPQIAPQYAPYFKKLDAMNVYSLGTMEDWAGAMLGGLGGEEGNQSAAVQLAKQAVFAELSKYKKGDVLLVPSIVLMLFEGMGSALQ